MATVSAHLSISEDFLEKGVAEVNAGDLLQGSEKLWGAAAHATKAVAEQRGWPHNSHGDLFATVRQLVAIQGTDQLNEGFRAANRLHRNFYNGILTQDEIRVCADQVGDFVGTLIDFLIEWE